MNQAIDERRRHDVVAVADDRGGRRPRGPLAAIARPFSRLQRPLSLAAMAAPAYNQWPRKTGRRVNRRYVVFQDDDVPAPTGESLRSSYDCVRPSG